MIYRELRPPPEQSAIVTCYWQFVVEASDPVPFRHTIMPDGLVSVSHARTQGDELGTVSVSAPGVIARHVSVTGPRLWTGMRFQPGVARKLLEINLPVPPVTSLVLAPDTQLARELTDGLGRCVDLADAADRMAPWIASRQSMLAQVDVLAARAAATLIEHGGAIRVSELALRTGLSARHLRRRFHGATGLSLKEFARVRRVRRAFIENLRLVAADWALIAAERYADQSHLCREFREVFGMPPNAIDAYIRSIRHDELIDI